MSATPDDASDVQTFVLAASIIGMAFVMIPLTISVSRFSNASAEQNLRSAFFLVAIGWPFALGFITRWWPWPQDTPRTRWFWLLSVLGIPLPIVVLHGLGILIAAVMLVYPWAFWMTRGTISRRHAEENGTNRDDSPRSPLRP